MKRLKINLLTGQALGIVKINKYIKWLKLSARVGVGVLLVLVILVFGAFFVTELQRNKTSEAMDNLISELEGKVDTEVLYRQYVRQAGLLGDIEADRKEYVELLRVMEDLLPNGVILEGLRIDEEVVIISVRANGVQEYAGLIDGVERVESVSGGKFSEVVMTQARRLVDGSYVVEFELGGGA